MPSATDLTAIFASKCSTQLIRCFGLGLGSNLPGRIAQAISPKLIAHLASQSKYGVLAISGTNGKSTTAGLASSIIKVAGFRIVHNRQGANLLPGVTASLVESSNFTGKLNTDYCLFEIDEAALPVVAGDIYIDRIVVTNLFRDQLDRFGELDTTAKLIDKGILANGSHAVLNADDPNVAQLAPESEKFYYGIESIIQSKNTPASFSSELAACPQCGKEFSYHLNFYGQLGHYYCQGCNYQRPHPDVSAKNVEVGSDSSRFTLHYKDESVDVYLALPGLFNVYNALAAAALSLSLGISLSCVRSGLENYVTLFGRSEKIVIKDKSLLIQLIKNPAGASQAVAAVMADPQARLLIAINDNIADGRDVSWLWDANFDQLNAFNKPIMVSGQRCYDMAVRLKYADVAEDKVSVEPDLKTALLRAIAEVEDEETLWVLPTYTALLELQKIVRSFGYNLSGT